MGTGDCDPALYGKWECFKFVKPKWAYNLFSTQINYIQVNFFQVALKSQCCWVVYISSCNIPVEFLRLFFACCPEGDNGTYMYRDISQKVKLKFHIQVRLTVSLLNYYFECWYSRLQQNCPPPILLQPRVLVWQSWNCDDGSECTLSAQGWGLIWVAKSVIGIFM